MIRDKEGWALGGGGYTGAYQVTEPIWWFSSLCLVEQSLTKKKKNPFISLCAYGVCECAVATMQGSLLSFYCAGPGHWTRIFVQSRLVVEPSWLAQNMTLVVAVLGFIFCLFPCPPINVIDVWVGAVCDRVSVGAGSTAQHSETRGQLWVLVLPPTLSEAGFLCKLCWLMNVRGLSSLHLSPLFRTTCITDMQDTVFGFMRVLEIQPRVLLLHCKCFIH